MEIDESSGEKPELKHQHQYEENTACGDAEMEESVKDNQVAATTKGEGKAAPTGVSARFNGPTQQQIHYKKIQQDVSPPTENVVVGSKEISFVEKFSKITKL